MKYMVCIYAIRAKGTNIVKVGQTCDPTSRMRQMQRSSPLVLDLVATAVCARCTRAEGVILELFTAYARRLHGEWFECDLTDEQLGSLFTAYEGFGLTHQAVPLFPVAPKLRLAA